jgi:DNA processing protein
MNRRLDSRVWLLLCFPDRGRAPHAAAPLSTAEWRRIGSRLREGGLARPGDLLEVRPSFWSGTGLDDAELARVRALLDRGGALDEELDRLEDLGFCVLTPADTGYPARLRLRLKGQAPPVLFGAGEWSLLDRPALAIAGSREVDEDGEAFTRAVAERCARDGLVVVTGGAKGVDQLAMLGALEAGGSAVGVPAGDLERTVRAEETQNWIAGHLLLLSPFHPRTGFSVANAMARNKVVYALADYGLVVSSAHGQGGTWAGASELRRHGWVPLFVRDGAGIPDGNRELLRPAALPFPPLESIGPEALPEWLARQIRSREDPASFQAEPGRIPAEAADLFPMVWPSLARFLAVSRSPGEIAAAFHLTGPQAKAWVLRAESEGCLFRLPGRTARYQAVLEPPLQSRLFERPAEYRAGGQPEAMPSVWPDDARDG